jgi:hypothetical protein
MIATVDGARSLRRYRLVVAQKSKLRLTSEVAAALASQSTDHRLTASGFFPCSIDREFLYGYAADGYRSLWLCASYDGNPVLVHRQRGTKIFFIKRFMTRRSWPFQASTTLMRIDYKHCCYKLRSFGFIPELAISQSQRVQETQLMIPLPKKNRRRLMKRMLLNRHRTKSLGARPCRTHQMILRKQSYQELRTN